MDTNARKLVNLAKKVDKQSEDFKKRIARLEKEKRMLDPDLKAENDMLRLILGPVLRVRFEKTGDRVATWFKEAVEYGKPSIRVFVKDYENAKKAIDAVTETQALWRRLMEEKP